MSLGFFGKLPAHGDFIRSGLNDKFIGAWDAWLQKYLLSVQRNRPDDWLQHYLVSPLWRFLIQDNQLGENAWCGVVMPSVDSVGRYFPFTVAAPLPAPALSPWAYLPALSHWYATIENLALDALHTPLSAETLGRQLDQQGSLPFCTDNELPAELDVTQWRWKSASEQASPAALLAALTRQAFQSPCYWEYQHLESGTGVCVMTEGFASFNDLIPVASLQDRSIS